MAKIILTSDILNKKEEVFRKENPYYFGAYYDLSDTPSEDLELDEITGGGGNDSNTGLKNNVLDATFYQKNNLWYVDIYSQYSTNSEISISFTYSYINTSNDAIQLSKNITLLAGSNNVLETKLDIPENINSISIVSLSCTPKSDETYKYTIKSTVVEKYSIYYGIRKYNTTDEITSENVILDMLFKECVSGDNEIEFTMPYVGIEGLNDMTDEEFNNALIENAQDFVILYSDNIKNYEVSYADAEIIDDNFIENNKYLYIDGQKYNILMRSDYTAQSPIREPSEINDNDLYEIHKRIFVIK